jgi:hypothetical protein
VLADGPFPEGYSEVSWDGRDSGGAEVASGIYFYRLETQGGVVETRRLTLSR